MGGLRPSDTVFFSFARFAGYVFAVNQLFLKRIGNLVDTYPVCAVP